MAERPILFSGPMVRAILDERKTVTRRVVRGDIVPHPLVPGARVLTTSNGKQFWLNSQESHPQHASKACPYGKPGDKLWVRETWGLWRSGRGSWLTESVVGVHRGVLDTWTVAFRADGEADGARWRPSIHMPRWASRITLDVVVVSVERLHDITEEDARAEGCLAGPCPDGWTGNAPHTHAFIETWNRINGAGSWAANPWVWRVEFRRTT